LFCITIGMVLGQIDVEISGPAGLLGIMTKRPGAARLSGESQNVEAEIVNGLAKDERSLVSIPLGVHGIQIYLGGFRFEQRPHGFDASMSSSDSGEGVLRHRRRIQVPNERGQKARPAAEPTSGNTRRTKPKSRSVQIEARSPDLCSQWDENVIKLDRLAIGSRHTYRLPGPKIDRSW
jgi:hypothetical protein